VVDSKYRKKLEQRIDKIGNDNISQYKEKVNKIFAKYKAEKPSSMKDIGSTFADVFIMPDKYSESHFKDLINGVDWTKDASGKQIKTQVYKRPIGMVEDVVKASLECFKEPEAQKLIKSTFDEFKTTHWKELKPEEQIGFAAKNIDLSIFNKGDQGELRQLIHNIQPENIGAAFNPVKNFEDAKKGLKKIEEYCDKKIDLAKAAEEISKKPFFGKIKEVAKAGINYAAAIANDINNNHNRDAAEDKQNLHSKKEKFANAINACSRKGRERQKVIIESVNRIKTEMKDVAKTAKPPLPKGPPKALLSR
jgi:hypothetical protein